jgi:hypothetical protein
MRTLKESILNKTKDRVGGIGEIIDRQTIFGNQFQLKDVRRLRDKNISCLSAKGLKEVTKGMDFIDDKVERGIFDRANKVRNLINFIEHINLIEWGFGGVNWSNDKVRGEFGEKLNNTLKELGCFNGKGYCWMTPVSYIGEDILRFMFTKHGAQVNDYFAIDFEYKN